jgi:hypothetical protein
MMYFPSQWIVPALATLVLGLEPLTFGARIANAASRVHEASLWENRTAPNSQVPVASVIGQENPVTIARRPRANSTAAQVEQFLSVHRVGMNAVRGCITDGFTPDCRRLVNSKSSLQNWCLQGKSEACSMFKTLSDQEAYQNYSDALLRSVQ